MNKERDISPSIFPDSGAKSPIFNGNREITSLLLKTEFSLRESAQIRADAQKAVLAKVAK